MITLAQVKKALQFELENDSVVKSYNAPVFAIFKPQNITSSFIAYTKLPGLSPTNVGLETATFQIDILGKNIEEAELIAESIKSWNKFGGNFGDEANNRSVKVNNIEVADFGEDYEKEISSFKRILELRIKFLR